MRTLEVATEEASVRVYNPHEVSTSAMTFGTVYLTTGEDIAVEVQNPLAGAIQYIKEKAPDVKEWLFHICRCNYCRSDYPANLEIGYECPACGAYSFEIERSIEK